MNASFSLWLRPVVLALAITASTTSASAGIIVPGTEQAHLDFAGDPMFQSVGWVRGVRDSGGFIAGSGVLIHPEWILTAAHVLDNGWDTVQFSFDADARDPNRTLYTADAWHLYPGFADDGGAGTANDIALIHLSAPIHGVTPAEIYWGDVSPGQHTYWAGYGKLAYFPSGEIGNGGIKMAGENVIDEVGSAFYGVHNQFMLSDFGPALGTAALSLEMGGTNGDSGGGWFADRNGDLSLIGITAFGRGSAFTLTGAIRPAMYSDFINEHVPTSVPEPASVMLILATLPAILARRLRAQRP